jgi:hypothetical protein
MFFRFSHVCGSGRAWKEQLIKKVHDRTNIVEMNDELGDLMYAKDEVELQAKWICFYKNGIMKAHSYIISTLNG